MPRGLAHLLAASPHPPAWPPSTDPPPDETPWLQVPAVPTPLPAPKIGSRARLRTAFPDLQRYWTGADMPEESAREDENVYVSVPKIDGVEWLGQVEDSKYLAKTDLYTKTFIGTHQNPKKKLKPGEWPECEPFLEYPGKPWWHPAFTFKVPIHAVRIRLTNLCEGEACLPAEKPYWDVTFAGQPGGIYKITNTHIPVGGKEPQFKPFCEPIKAKTKLELRITEAEEERWDERLTLMTKEAASLARLNFVKGGSKPRVPSTTKDMYDGPVNFRIPEDEQEKHIGPSGYVNYMSMPPLLVAGALAGFL